LRIACVANPVRLRIEDLSSDSTSYPMFSFMSACI
jgi:hypothetical protein